MAKRDLYKQAQKANLVPADSSEDDYTEAQLHGLLNPESKPAWEGSLSDAPVMPAPDGHDGMADKDERIPAPKA